MSMSRHHRPPPPHIPNGHPYPPSTYIHSHHHHRSSSISTSSPPTTAPPGRDRIRIAIVGAGIAGLTLAIALRRSSPYASSVLDIQIFEQSPSFSSMPGGENMTLHPRGVEILKSLGAGSGGNGGGGGGSSSTGDIAKGFLAMSCRGFGGNVDGRLITVRKSGYGIKGKETVGKVLYDLVADSHGRQVMLSASDSISSSSSPSSSPTHSPTRSRPSTSRGGNRIPVAALASFHRNHLLDLLATYLPSSSIHFNTQLVSYSPSAPSSSSSSLPGTQTITLQFSNGTSATCDVVFACDGLYSLIRRGMMNGYRFPSPSQANGIPPSLVPPGDVFWTGSSVLKASLPISKLKANFPRHGALTGAQVYTGPSTHIITYPANYDREIAIMIVFTDQQGAAAFKSAYRDSCSSAGRAGWYSGSSGANTKRLSVPGWMRSFSRESLMERFDSWEMEVKQLLGLLDPKKLGNTCSTHPINTQLYIPSFVAPPIAISSSPSASASSSSSSTPCPSSSSSTSSTRVSSTTSSSRLQLPTSTSLHLPEFGEKHTFTPRIALLGDAAHAPPPHVLSSATVAMEDAFLLGKLFNSNFSPFVNASSLSSALNGFKGGSRSSKQVVELHLPTALKSIDKILKAYDEMRCPSPSSSGKLLNIVEKSVDAGIAFSGFLPSNPYTLVGSGSSRETGRECDLSWVPRAL